MRPRRGKAKLVRDNWPEVTAMAEPARIIDIGDNPDLVRIAEEVRASREPSVLRRANEDLALIVPMPPDTAQAARPAWEQALDAAIWRDTGVHQPPALWAHYDPQRVRSALRASAGALAGIDRDGLLAELREARGPDSSGPPAGGCLN